MNIPGWSRFGGVEIGVGIDPDHSQLAVFCRASDRTNRQTMIASQYQWETISLHGGCHRTSNAPPHRNDAINIFEFRISDLTRFLNGHFNIAFIFNGMTQLFKPLPKMRIPNGAGTHIHTAAVRTKINWHTDNIYLHISLQLYFFNKFSHAIAPAILGTIQSFVRGLYDIITCRTMFRESGHTR